MNKKNMAKSVTINASIRMSDKELILNSPFLEHLVGDGEWKDIPQSGSEELIPGNDEAQSIKEFRVDFRRSLNDPEKALLSLRRMRVRSMLALARADLDDQIKPHQIRARLRNLAEFMVQGSWWAAESNLRKKYVHPMILERRNVNPPMAIFSLSRLGSGEPWYTTGPAPVFVHTRAAEFAPALTEKDFSAARRVEKEWLPAREYFHRLAGRTMSYLSIPDPAGKGFAHMAEDIISDNQPPLLPGALVILLSAFEEHFLGKRPLKERLSLMRLRFLVGQERLGRTVESAARTILLKTAIELGPKLRSGVNSWYRDRARAEGLPMKRGGLLDIERGIRLIQFRLAPEDPTFLEPNPLKGIDRLAAEGVISGDERLILNRSYSYQWFLANRMSLLGRRSESDWEDLESGRLDERLYLAGAAEKVQKMAKDARDVLTGITRETKADADS